MKTVIFNSGRADYYREKKAKRARQLRQRQLVAEDARYVVAYGMESYIKLFPEALGMSIGWHKALLDEVERLRRVNIAQMITGMALASSQTKKGNRELKKYVNDLMR